MDCFKTNHLLAHVGSIQTIDAICSDYATLLTIDSLDYSLSGRTVYVFLNYSECLGKIPTFNEVRW